MKKIHLMSRRWPASFCGMRLRDNSGMYQTFIFNEITCEKCISEVKKRKLGKKILDLIDQKRLT
jgi:hypothetical protein